MISNSGFQEFGGAPTPALSAVGFARAYYDATRKALMASQEGGPYLAGSPGVATFVFRPSDPAPAVNVFTTWQDLVDALNAPAACTGRRYVQIDDSLAACVIPAGSYDLIGAREIVWGGIFSRAVGGLFTFLTVSDGVDFPSGCFFVVTDFLVVTTEGTTPAITIPSGERAYFQLDRGGRLVATGSAPLIDVPDGIVIFEIGLVGALLSGGTPVVNAGATSTITLLVTAFFSTLGADAISGDVGSILTVDIVNAAAGNVLEQTTFLGTTFLNITTRASRVIMVAIPVVGTYDVGPLDSVIIADATTGAFPVNLPDADLYEGREIVVKKTDASGNIVTLTPFTGSQTIDDSPTFDLIGQYQVVRIVASGGLWFQIGQG